ncbi:MAG: hypothetical protein HGA61_00065 [Candidatus Moranbacteria bacterium]|nr:hypothetical protein [Candidatus Moranbacteria bacterium]
MSDFKKIFDDSQYIIQHKDDVLAHKALKEVEVILADEKNQFDPQLFSKIHDLKLKLEIVNFPNLSEEKACDILQNHYLESFSIEVSMENRITAMMFFYPDIPRNELRKKLKNALLQNQQKIGQLTISQWIGEFEKMFPVATRDLSASVRFSISHPQVRSLSSVDRENLKDILHVYDYLLVTTLPATGPVLEEILQADLLNEKDFSENSFAKSLEAEQKRFIPYEISSKQHQEDITSQRIVSMPLSQALGTFLNLGEQAITSNPLKLRYFPTPVKPSIKNWITDYRDSLGAGKHTTIDRGNYLFHGENGKKLTPVERQKISVLLKSLDEGTLLEINSDFQSVIFNSTEKFSKIKNVEITPLLNLEKSAEPAEDLMQARIRQSLDFSKTYANEPEGKKEKPNSFNFEEDGYPKDLIGRKAPEPKSDLRNFPESEINFQNKTKAGSFSFSSAQELPVEKDNVGSNKTFPSPVSSREIIPEKKVQTWNSPDFKSQIEKEKPSEEKKVANNQSVQAFRKQRSYSPYIIEPLWEDDQKNKPKHSFDVDPKIKGNTVDLS